MAINFKGIGFLKVICLSNYLDKASVTSLFKCCSYIILAKAFTRITNSTIFLNAGNSSGFSSIVGNARSLKNIWIRFKNAI